MHDHPPSQPRRVRLRIEARLDGVDFCQRLADRRARRRQEAPRGEATTNPPGADHRGSGARSAATKPSEGRWAAFTELAARLTSGIRHIASPPQDAASDGTFADSALQRVFVQERYLAWVQGYPHRFFGPLLGLYAGLRADEVARLDVDHVVHVHGHWCLSVRPLVALSGSPFTACSGMLARARFVPVPPALVDAGFLDFVSDMRALGYVELFPHLSTGWARPDDSRDAAMAGVRLAGQFCVYASGHGGGEPEAFHSLAATLRAKLVANSVSPVVMARIFGEPAGVRALQEQLRLCRLSGAPPVSQCAEALAGVRFPVRPPVYSPALFAGRLTGPAFRRH